MSKLHKNNSLKASAEGAGQGSMEYGLESETAYTPDMDSQIGEADTWLDKVKTLVRQNKLAAFSAVVIVLILLAAIFAPLVAPYDI